MRQLVVCGGGSSAHTLIPLLNDSGFDVSIYTSKPDCWSKQIELEWHDPSGNILGLYSGNLKSASNNPAELFPEADYVIFCMPVHKYRVALHEIAPYLNKNKNVFVGAVYGQGGWNWMVNEIKKEYGLDNLVTFAFGLIPWICRIIEYGKKGVTYGCKEVNYAAVFPNDFFKIIDEDLLEKICYKWFGKGFVRQSDNFLSLTMSVDNQIIHSSRCLGLYKVYGKTWKTKDDVPWFYRDYDDLSAKLLADLDNDYSKIRDAIKKLHPEKDYSYMLDYLALERFSYQSQNTDIKESFVNSQTLVSIGTPVVENIDGLWEVDRNHRFFLDDIYYGNMIAKWMAQQLNIITPTIDEILHWAQEIRGEKFIDENDQLILDSPDLSERFKCGIPTVYGFQTIEDCMD